MCSEARSLSTGPDASRRAIGQAHKATGQRTARSRHGDDVAQGVPALPGVDPAGRRLSGAGLVGAGQRGGEDRAEGFHADGPDIARLIGEFGALAHPRRRPRAVRHGFGRSPGYCRERERRRAGDGVGDGDSAMRSWAASASCSRRSRCSGERCGGGGAATGASVLEGRSPAPSPLLGGFGGVRSIASQRLAR